MPLKNQILMYAKIWNSWCNIFIDFLNKMTENIRNQRD